MNKYMIIADCFVQGSWQYVQQERIVDAESINEAVTAFEEIMFRSGYVLHKVLKVEQL